MKKINKIKLRELLSARHEENEYKSLADIPKPTELKDITKAAKRVKKAIDNCETITIVGDYDVDGVVSTAIVVDFFRHLNVKVNYIIPNRFTHGYGLSPKIIEMIDNGLIITVDNGISATIAADICREKEIDLIITDHHTVPSTLPYAYAIVNPKQQDCNFPFSEICGAQVAWYLCAAIKKEINAKIDMRLFLDYLALAVIADIMPMTSLNYTMVKSGLKLMKVSRRPAFNILNNLMQKEQFVSDDVGFFIAPRLNSAGRLKDASIALSFLLSQNLAEAEYYFDQLNMLNNSRKELQNDIIKDAMDQVCEDEDIIVVYSSDWNEGIIGIVASRLVDKYKRPAFVFCESDGKLKGSARTPDNGVHLYELIDNIKELLIGFGGHKGAAGLALEKENLDAFKKKINEIYISPSLCESDVKYLDVIGELVLDDLDFEFISILEEFEPYGLNNKKPKFKLSNIKIDKYSYLGRNKDHLKIIIKYGDKTFDALDFHTDIELSGSEVMSDLVVSITKNEYRGNTRIQFLIEDIIFI